MAKRPIFEVKASGDNNLGSGKGILAQNEDE